MFRKDRDKPDAADLALRRLDKGLVNLNQSIKKLRQEVEILQRERQPILSEEE